MKLIKELINKAVILFSIRSQKNKFVKDLLKKEAIITEATIEENLIMSICSKYSMTSKVRMWALIQSIKYLVMNEVPGDIVETGVFKGGNLILSKKILDIHSPDSKRTIYGYDTFEGMAKPGENDKDIFGENPIKFWSKNINQNYNAWCYSSIEEVKKNFTNETSNNSSLKLIKGKVEQTLLEQENLPEKISLLRLDTDWYESSKIELEILYPRLVKGGVLIIDDYGHWEGVKKSVDEYFLNKNIWLHYIDYGCRLLIK